MPDLQQNQLQNRLLSRLSEDDFARLADHLEPLDYPQAMTISEADQLIPYILFPEKGLISIVAVSREGESAESGLVGREGFSTSAIMLGTDRILHRVEVRLGGQGHRVEIDPFKAAVASSRSLQEVLQTLAVQTAFTAMSNAILPWKNVWQHGC